MLHNSLLIRDRLLQANTDPLRRHRRTPHRNLVIDATATPQEEELALVGTWRVSTQGELQGLSAAKEDLSAFLDQCGVSLSQDGRGTILLAGETDASFSGFQRTVDRDAIIIKAATTTGLWAGVVDLEQTIALRGAAILPAGPVEREPSWPIQIGQAPFGANYLVPDLAESYLSDDAFCLLTHYGLTGMTIYGDWLLYVDNDRYPELSHPDYEHNIAVLRDAVQRAAQYGIKLYFVPVSPKLPADHPVFQRQPELRGSRIGTELNASQPAVHNLCSSSPKSLAFHQECFSRLFQAVPELGGLILIVGGESYYHCFMRPDKTELQAGEKTNCARCRENAPEAVVANLIEATATAVHRTAPDAPVFAWPYSAHGWSRDSDQVDLIRRLPAGVRLLTEIDKDAWVDKGGYEKHIWDYSIDFTGPSNRILRQAAEVRSRNLQLAVKTETALGLECIQVPYVPALQRLGEKWTHVRDLAPAAVLQSWMFFGMWGSPAEELGWWANWRSDLSLETAIQTIASRDFGPSAEQVLAAWEEMSIAVSHLPYIPSYFRGPEFIGPCHPLQWDRNQPTPELFHAALYYLQENEATFSTTAKEVLHSLVMSELPEQSLTSHLRVAPGVDPWSIVISELGQAAAAAERAYAIILAVATNVQAPPSSALGEQLGLIEFLYRTWTSTDHTIRFVYARDRWEATRHPGHHREMRAIAQAEMANAKAAHHLFSDYPWLNLALRLDGKYPDSTEMLEAKIAMLEPFIDAST